MWLEWRLSARHEIAFEPEVLPLPRASVKCGEETVAIEDVVTVGAAVSSSAWLGVFISAPAKSTPTRIELYPREFVFCPYRDPRRRLARYFAVNFSYSQTLISDWRVIPRKAASLWSLASMCSGRSRFRRLISKPGRVTETGSAISKMSSPASKR
jgi:hypothetical protein